MTELLARVFGMAVLRSKVTWLSRSWPIFCTVYFSLVASRVYSHSGIRLVLSVYSYQEAISNLIHWEDNSACTQVVTSYVIWLYGLSDSKISQVTWTLITSHSSVAVEYIRLSSFTNTAWWFFGWMTLEVLVAVKYWVFLHVVLYSKRYQHFYWNWKLSQK